MTRQDFLTKWLVYGVALLPIWFLETYVLNRFPVFGVSPLLLPLAAVTVAVLEGGAAGAGYGLFVGVLCDALYATAGAMTFGLMLLGAAAGMTAQFLLRQNLLGCYLCSTGALVLMDACRILWRLFWGQAELTAMLGVALPELLWSLAFLPLVYWVFSWVHRRTQFATLF
ncbi:MAG: rod shape-determining protein MreD [Pseudoflavonifractor sp.]